MSAAAFRIRPSIPTAGRSSLVSSPCPWLLTKQFSWLHSTKSHLGALSVAIRSAFPNTVL